MVAWAQVGVVGCGQEVWPIGIDTTGGRPECGPLGGNGQALGSQVEGIRGHCSKARPGSFDIPWSSVYPLRFPHTGMKHQA